MASLQSILNDLTNVSSANAGDVLTKDGSNAIFKAPTTNGNGITYTNLRSNANIADIDMSDISGWTDSDGGNGESSQVTFDSKSCMKLDGGSSGGSNYAFRQKDVGTLTGRSVITVNVYCGAGTRANGDRLDLEITSSDTTFSISFCSDGAFVYDAEENVTEIGSGLVVLNTWQKWTFDVDWTSKTADVYLGDELKASNVDCSYYGSGVNGLVIFLQNNPVTANRISYIDYIKIGTDLISDTVLPINITGESDNTYTEGLKTASGIVNVSSATAPTTGQVLTATGATTATWQTPSGGSGVSYSSSTWQPELKFGGSSTGITYSNQGGVYFKINNMVVVSGIITLSNKGSATGLASITLPFTCKNGTNYYTSVSLEPSNITYSGMMTGVVITNSASFNVDYVVEGGNYYQLSNSNFSDSSQLIFSTTFYTDD